MASPQIGIILPVRAEIKVTGIEPPVLPLLKISLGYNPWKVSSMQRSVIQRLPIVADLDVTPNTIKTHTNEVGLMMPTVVEFMQSPESLHEVITATMQLFIENLRDGKQITFNPFTGGTISSPEYTTLQFNILRASLSSFAIPAKPTFNAAGLAYSEIIQLP